MARHKYVITVLNSAPADLVGKVSAIHASAIQHSKDNPSAQTCNPSDVSLLSKPDFRKKGRGR